MGGAREALFTVALLVGLEDIMVMELGSFECLALKDVRNTFLRFIM